MAAIVGGDIIVRGTVITGAAGGGTAQTDPMQWLGKYASTTAWAGGSLNDLFNDITGAQNAASQVDYRGIAVHNSNASNIYQNATVYLSAEVAGGAAIALAVDTIAASAYTGAGAQLAQIASVTTAPSGVSAYSSPTTAATGISLGSIGTAQVKGVWVRRTASNSSALSADGFTLGVNGDTGSL